MKPINKLNFETINSQLAQLPTKNNVKNGNLRIIFSGGNIELNQEQITLIKSLGFNCILLYKQTGNAYLYNSISTLAFLDKLSANGVSVIMSIDVDIMAGASYATEQIWLEAIQSHSSIIGFESYDEPIARQITKANQELVYDRIKEKTNKDVFIVDPINIESNYKTYYTSKSFDVFLYDGYTNQLNAAKTDFLWNTNEKRKLTLWYNLDNLFNIKTDTPPKTIIPILPFFSQTIEGDIQFGIMTPTMLQDMLDVYAMFNITNYGCFIFNILSTVNGTGTSIGENVELQKLCLTLSNRIYNSKQERVLISAKGFNINKNFVSSNMEFGGSQTGQNLICSPSGTTTKSEIITKISISNNAKKLYARVNTINYYDVAPRKCSMYLSDDGITYTVFYEEIFTNGTLGYAIIAGYGDIPIGTKTLYCKIEIDNQGTATNKDYVGMELISIVAM